MIITARNAILAASTALVFATAPALAQDFVIDGTFVNPDATNGPFADTAFDIDGTSVLMTEGSSIDVSDAAGENAIQATGDNITIEVRGALATLGNNTFEGGNGIYFVGDSAVMILTETGSITTADDRAYGQFIDGDDGFISNSGSITTHSEDGFAQRLEGDFGTLMNSGAITILGRAGRGQSIDGDGGRIVNTGTITTSGPSAWAQDATRSDGTGVTINAGTITTWGDASVGQYADGEIINTGSITHFGDTSIGQILGGTDGTLTNSGRLVSVNGLAIRFDDRRSGHTLNFLAPGFIGGGILFDQAAGTPTVINVTSGPSHSIFWTLEGDTMGGAPNFFGPVPWFYNAATQTVATFDPTLLASETDALGDLTALLSRAGLGAVQGFGSGLGTGLSSVDLGALAYLPVNDDGDAVSQRLGRAWVTALGGQMDHDGGATTLDSTIGHFGFAGGYIWQHTPDMILNAMAGYVAGNAEANAVWAPSFDHDTHTLFAGLHGEHQLNRAAVQFGLTAGHSWIDHNRLVNDNLAPLGESWVSADYGGFFVSPELGVSTDILLQNGMTLTPNAGLRYAAQWLGGYSESGAVSAAANAIVENRFVGTVEARAGLDITRSFDVRGRTGTVTGGIGYLGRWGGGDDDASITLNGVTQSVASGHQDLNAVTVSATLLSDIGETGFLELDANYFVGDTAQGFDGRLTMGMAF
ncbi:MAG: autotransporter domain-containing protein [Alphaproteobacteria bacterium]